MTAAENWHRLDTELAAWQDAGRTAWFWWRDDDAADATPALTRLLELQRRTGAPLTLAVIPDGATDELAKVLSGAAGIAAAQHGFSHRNFAPAGTKKSEFPPERPAEDCLQTLASGRQKLAVLLGEKLLPVLVPPWNRFADSLLQALPGLGFSVISTFRIATSYWAAPGLARLNTHLDPVDWHGRGDATAGATACLDTALDLLAGLRTGRLPPQALGLLSHHLRHDSAGWDFLAAFLARTAQHPAVRWVDAGMALEIGKPLSAVMPPS